MALDIPDRVHTWRGIAKRVLECRTCSFLRETQKVVHPDPGWGNLYAPIFVVGINGNWGLSRGELPRDPDLAGVSDYQYRLVSRYWDRATNLPDATRFFDSMPRCSDIGTLRSRVERWHGELDADFPQYDTRLFSHVSQILRRHGVKIDGQLDLIDKRTALWSWMYYANAVRCPSLSAAEVPEEEFENCFWGSGAPGNVLSEELRLVRPSLILVLGYSTITGNRSNEKLPSHLGKLLGMECRSVQNVEVPAATSQGAASFRVCEYDSLHALLLPHPNWPVRGVFNERVRDAVTESWSRCDGAPPKEISCVNLPA